jgi:hypothetical protein
VRHRDAAVDGRHSAAAAVHVGAALKRDVDESDGGVADAEGWTRAAAAIEDSGAWRASYDERRRVSDKDGGLVEDARAEAHVPNADKLNRVRDGSADQRRVANRVAAAHRVNLHRDTGCGGGSWQCR